MRPRNTVLRRRRDGLVEIHRARARDALLTSDAVVLLGMLGGFLFFAALLVVVLVFDPPFLAVALWAVVAVAVERRTSGREPRGSEVRLPPPPGSAA